MLGRRWKLRNQLLLLCGLVLFGFLGLGWFAFGLRLPPLQWEPSPRAWSQKSSSGLFFVEAKGAYFLEEKDDVLVFRAFVPEPTLIVTCKEATTAKVLVQNLSPQLLPGSVAPSQIEGLQRRYAIPVVPGEGQLIRPRFATSKKQFRFVAIGDTGGEAELARAIQRATDLGADFFLHLGDIEYEEDGILHAAQLFQQAPIPVFAAIGNHDFHRGLDLVHKSFTQWIGPRNSYFRLGGVDFLNLDTAADTYPADGGERGRLIASLDLPHFDRSPFLVLWTHRPLRDPRPNRTEDEGHALGSAAERKWLAATATAVGADLLLHGHIHQSFAFEEEGIPAFIVGNGLALPEENTSREEPSLLVGEWQVENPQVQCHWERLDANK